MRLPASEKLEIIRLVEQSHLPARRTLKMLDNDRQILQYLRWCAAGHLSRRTRRISLHCTRDLRLDGQPK